MKNRLKSIDADHDFFSLGNLIAVKDINEWDLSAPVKALWLRAWWFAIVGETRAAKEMLDIIKYVVALEGDVQVELLGILHRDYIRRIVEGATS